MFLWSVYCIFCVGLSYRSLHVVYFHHVFYVWLPYCVTTRSSAIAEGPHEALVKSCNYKTSHLKTRLPDLLCGIICVILRLSVLIQYRNMTDTHRQTDRHTMTAYTALSIASCGKNRPHCTAHQLRL